MWKRFKTFKKLVFPTVTWPFLDVYLRNQDYCSWFYSFPTSLERSSAQYNPFMQDRKVHTKLDKIYLFPLFDMLFYFEIREIFYAINCPVDLLSLVPRKLNCFLKRSNYKLLKPWYIDNVAGSNVSVVYFFPVQFINPL